MAHADVTPRKAPREAFTATEWRLIQRLNTPARVQQYLSSLPYNGEVNGPTLRSFRELIKAGEAHCLEAAVAAAVILEQHGFSPLLLDLESKDLLDHVLFVFKWRRAWGSVGRSRDIGLHGRKPVYRSLRDLAWSYFDPFVDFSGRLKGYAVTSLYELGAYDWRFSPRRIIKIEEHLRALPHQPLRSSDQRYERLLARYHRFKKRYPDRSPAYYDSRDKWML